MLKCASVYTFEVDEPDVALMEIKTQLNEKITLLEHTAGIIMCHPEFIASGVLKYICSNLPFDLAGVTTSSQSVNEMVGELMLTIFIMTSDDIFFKTGVVECADDDIVAPLKAAFDNVAAVMPELPKLVIVFPPFGLRSGDVYIKAWGEIVPNTPVFGTLAIDDTATFRECETLYKGVNSKTAMSFVLCYGNINPRFLTATLSENNAVSSKAEVTKADGNCVYEISHMNAFKFFEEKGFADSVLYTPFMIEMQKREDYDDVPVIRGMALFTGEGAALFHGDVNEGSTVTLLRCEPDDIVSTTRREIQRINEFSDVNGALLFPCVVRRVSLLDINKPLLELQVAKDEINRDIPFMMGYAGGEICPTSVRNGALKNCFHNYSLVILVI